MSLLFSLLMRMDASQAKAELRALQGELQKGKADTEGLASAAAVAAVGMDDAAATAGAWSGDVQMVRAAIQPMVGEMVALQAASQQLAAYEEIGALTAREAAQAHDLLARQITDLVGRMEQAGVTIDGTTTAMARQDTTVQALINRLTGVSTATEGTVADTLRHGQALDDLRARFNPLFAASRQYEVQLREIAEAERLGAISAMEAAQARDRAALALAPIPGQLGAVGTASAGAAAHMANLGYQLNDITMMMAMGQSPFMLMMQQGPQVVQLFAQMRASGQAIGPAIAGAFRMMVNPMGLATMAVIGFGAAAVQHFTAAASEAETAEDAISRLASIQGDLEKAQRIAEMSIDQLIDKYGAYAFAAREAARAVLEASVAEAQTALKKGIAEAADEWTRYAATMDAATAADPTVGARGAWGQFAVRLGETRQALADLQTDLGVTEAEAVRLADAFAAVQQAASFDERLAAMLALREALQAAGVSAGDLPPALQSALSAAANLNLEMVGLASAADQARGTLDDARGALVAMVAAAPGGGWLRGAIGDAATLAGTLWNAAAAAAAARADGFEKGIDPKSGGLYSGRGQDPRLFGANAGTSNTFNVPNFKMPEINVGSGAGTGGGAAAAREESDAVAELIAKMREEQETLRELDPVKREMLKHRQTMAEATAAERAEVEELIRTEIQLKAAQQAREYASDAVGDFLDQIIVKGAKASDVLRNLAAQFLAMAARSFITGQGWFAQAIGLAGPLFGGVKASQALAGGGMVGSQAGAIGPAARPGLPMRDLRRLPGRMADAIPSSPARGMVLGAGGPRDDAILIKASAGEFMVNARATAQWRPVLERINAGAVPGFAAGGMIGAGTATGAPGAGASLTAGGPPVFNIHLHGATGNAEITQLVQDGVRGQLEAYDRRVLPARLAHLSRNPRERG